MKTSILAANEPHTIAVAAAAIQAGELVAFPTETVYGLGANALNAAAVEKIYVAKDRPADNPLIVHVASPRDIETLVSVIPPIAQRVIQLFMPGPISVVLPKSAVVPSITTAGLETIVVRCPSHPVARALIKAAGVPIAAPSANLSGRVSPTKAEHVLSDLDGRIPYIIDAGTLEYGLESTVIDCTGPTPILLRPGAITKEMLEVAIGPIDTAGSQSPVKSPGMKYRHYAPHTPVLLFTGHPQDTEAAILTMVAKLPPTERVAIIGYSAGFIESNFVRTLSADPIKAAPLLFGALRELDTTSVSRIIVQGYDDRGVGAAIMNRLRKAASSMIEL